MKHTEYTNKILHAVQFFCKGVDEVNQQIYISDLFSVEIYSWLVASRLGGSSCFVACLGQLFNGSTHQPPANDKFIHSFYYQKIASPPTGGSQ